MSFQSLGFRRERSSRSAEPDDDSSTRTLIGSFVYTMNESENFGEYIYNQIQWIVWYHHQRDKNEKTESFYVLEDPKGHYSQKLPTEVKDLKNSVIKLYEQSNRLLPEIDPYKISEKILFEISTHQTALQELDKISKEIKSSEVLISDMVPIVMEFLKPTVVTKRPYFAEIDFVDPRSGEVGGLIRSYELERRCSLPFQNEYFVLHCTQGPFQCWFDGYKEQIYFVDLGFEKDLEDETYFINVVQQNK